MAVARAAPTRSPAAGPRNSVVRSSPDRSFRTNAHVYLQSQVVDSRSKNRFMSEGDRGGNRFMGGQPPRLSTGRGPALCGIAQLMRKHSIFSLVSLLLLVSCSPREYLTRRLAA